MSGIEGSKATYCIDTRSFTFTGNTLIYGLDSISIRSVVTLPMHSSLQARLIRVLTEQAEWDDAVVDRMRHSGSIRCIMGDCLSADL